MVRWLRLNGEEATTTEKILEVVIGALLAVIIVFLVVAVLGCATTKVQMSDCSEVTVQTWDPPAHRLHRWIPDAYGRREPCDGMGNEI
jgi:hypothetical protein